MRVACAISSYNVILFVTFVLKRLLVLSVCFFFLLLFLSLNRALLITVCVLRKPWLLYTSNIIAGILPIAFPRSIATLYVWQNNRLTTVAVYFYSTVFWKFLTSPPPLKKKKFGCSIDDSRKLSDSGSPPGAWTKPCDGKITWRTMTFIFYNEHDGGTIHI